MPAVLALDIATKTGWALHKPGMERPFFGTLQLASTPGEVGEPMNGLYAFLLEQHRLHGGIAHFVFEAQHVGFNRRKKTDAAGNEVAISGMDPKVLKKLYALAGMVEWFAHCVKPAGVNRNCWEVHIGTWRKHFLGRGNLNRERAKITAMDECRRIGIFPPDDNAAEAMGILDYFLSIKRLGGKPWPRPWRDVGLFLPLGAEG